MDKLLAIRAALQGSVVPVSDFKVVDSREYGASYALQQIATRTGLAKAIYSKPGERWVRDSIAMAIGRVVYAGSKLSLSHCGEYSALWDVCGIQNVDVDVDCYEAMDRLLGRQDAIQKTLAQRHMQDGSLVLYDITSSYLEGEYEGSNLVDFGYNRDRKKGHKQVVVSLLCSGDGCPVAVEVFAGNTKDETTVLDKIAEIRDKYGIKNVIFTGDRGMVTMTQYEQIDHDTVKVVSALTHKKIESLMNEEVIQLGMFDEKNIVEVIDGDIRYCLCKNPEMAKRETNKRNALVEKTCEELEKIKASTRKSKNSKQMRAGKIVEKYKVGKFFTVAGDDANFDFALDKAKISEEQSLDGCYVIFTDVPEEDMPAVQAVECYKRLTRVEQAFRSMKTVRLEMRPMYHKKDERIRCHVFICMLAYYLMWHMRQGLAALTPGDGHGSGRKYSFNYAMEILKAIRENTVDLGGAEAKVISTPTEEQQKILDAIDVNL
jgi:transposase